MREQKRRLRHRVTTRLSAVGAQRKPSSLIASFRFAPDGSGLTHSLEGRDILNRHLDRSDTGQKKRSTKHPAPSPRVTGCVLLMDRNLVARYQLFSGEREVFLSTPAIYDHFVALPTCGLV
jgi:hypothetical protein